MANDVRISVSVDNNTSRGLDAIRASIAELRAEAARNIRVVIDVDQRGFGEARAELARLRADAARGVRVRTSSSGGGATSDLGGAMRVADAAASSFAAKLAMIGPMAAQAAAAVGQIALQAVGAGAALAVLAAAALPGLMEIKGALALHTAAQKENTAATTAAVGPNYALINAKRSLADAVRSASRSIVDADEALADAEKQLGRVARQNAQDIAAAKKQVVQAQESEASAERNLTDANKNAVQAQKALNDARKEAADDLKALNDQLIDSQLATEDATLRVQDAQEQLNATLKDPTASNLKRQEAQLAVAEAQQALKEQIESNNKLKASAADQAKAGVEGSQKVIDAKDKVAQASEQQVEAEQNVRDAQESVRDAVQGVADAQVQASERTADAQEQVADAARNVARAHEDAASSIASAQAAVQQAMASTAASAGKANTAQQQYNDALAKMNPATRQAYDELLKLKAAFKAWGDSLAPSTMPIFTTSMQIIIDLLPKLTPLVKGAAKVIQDLLDKFKTKLEHGDLDDIIDKFNKWSISSLKAIVRYIGDFVDAIKRIVVSQNFKDFMDDVNKNGPMMADTLKQLGDFIGKFIVAAGPMAGLSFKVLDALATTLNAIPMPVLNVLAPLLLGVAFGIKAVSLAMMLLDANPIVLIIAAVALAAILIATHWKQIKSAMETAWNWIYKNVLTPMKNFFTKTIPGAATTVWHAIRDAWNHVKSAMGSAYDWVKKNVLNPIVNFFTKTIPGAGGKLVSFFSGLPGKITRATRGMWDGIKNTFKSAINGLIDIWNKFHLTMPKVSVLGHTIIPGFTINTPNLPHLAHGGISGGGLAMVGENGPELVHLPGGSHVRSNPDSMSTGHGGAQKFEFYFVKGGDPLMDMVMDKMKDRIRVRHGGSVNTALGT